MVQKRKDRLRIYRNMSNIQLNEKIKELQERITSSYSFVEDAKEKSENRTRLRKEIARIKTILIEREK